MNLRASRNLEIKSIHAIITLKIEEERPEIIEYLKGNDLGLSEEEKDVFETQYIDRYLGLLRDGELTQAGKRALKSGTVLIPEQGLYELLLVEDPLFEKNIIKFIRIRPENKLTTRDSQALHDFHEYHGRFFKSWEKDSKEFQIYFEGTRNTSPQVIHNESLFVSVTIDSGEHTGTSIAVKSEELLYNDYKYQKFELYENLGNLVHGWNNDIHAKEVSFKDVKHDTLISFRENQTYEGELNFSWGSDDHNWDIEITDLKVLPKTRIDAEKWLTELIKTQVYREKAYCTLEYITHIQEKILEEAPLREKYADLRIGEEKFYNNIKNEDVTVFKLIQVAEDLKLA